MDGQSWPSNVPLHYFTQNSFFRAEKKITNVWDYSYAANTLGGKSVVTHCYQTPIYYDIH
jgi:hypothetical protein